MPAGDDLTIRTTLVVDGVENVKAAMGEAATAVQTSAQKMVASVNATQENMRKTIATSLREQNATAEHAAQIYNQLGIGGEQAAKEIAAAFGTVAPAAGTATAATDKAAASSQKFDYSVTQARLAATGLGRELGVTMPRHLSTFLARLEGVGPLLTAAFSAVAVIAFIDIFERLIGKIAEAGEALGSYRDKQRRAFEEALAENQRMLEANFRHRESLIELGTAGKEGFGKVRAEQEALAEKIRTTIEYQREFKGALASAEEAERKLHEVTIRNLTMSGDKREREIQKQLATIEDLRRKLGEVNRELQFALPLERQRLATEVNIEGWREALDQLNAFARAERTVGIARVDQAENIARQLRSVYAITLADQTAALVSAEEQRLEIQRSYFQRQREILLRRQRETGKTEAPELTTLAAEEEAAVITSQSRIQAIRRAGAEAERREVEQLALAKIEGARSVTAALTALAAAEREGLRSSRRATIDEELSDARTYETERYATARSALEERLRLAEQEPERNKVLIRTLQTELQAMAVEHQTRLTEIENDGQRARTELSERLLAVETSAAENEASRRLEITRRENDQAYAERRIGLAQFQALETAAVNSWYEDQRAILTRWVNFTRATYGEASAEYRSMIERARALDLERAEELQRINLQVRQAQLSQIRQVDAEFKRSLTSWIVGYQDFRSAVLAVWGDLLTRIVGYIIEIGARQIEQWILETVFHQGEKAQQLASTAASAAAETAVVSAQNVGQVTSEAAVAAATAYAAYAWDPPLAEAMAAEAFAATMAWAPVAAFEQGGIVPKTDLALLHEKEMVLPEHISVMLQEAAGRRAEASEIRAPRSMSLSYAPTVQAIDRRGVDQFFRQNAREVSKMVRKEMRRGRLPSL
jgi:hypothetical protein